MIWKITESLFAITVRVDRTDQFKTKLIIHYFRKSFVHQDSRTERKTTYIEFDRIA